MPSKSTAALAPLLLLSCLQQPEPYAPPIQRRPASDAPSSIKHFAAMNQPDAPAYILSDVSPHLEGGLWRWTGQHPRFRFILAKTKNIRFVADFSVPAHTFQSTGPVTVSFSVNDRLLDRLTCSGPGEQHFEKPVPEAWLSTGTTTLVALDLDKIYVAPEDGNRLGLTLVRIGFLD